MIFLFILIYTIIGILFAAFIIGILDCEPGSRGLAFFLATIWIVTLPLTILILCLYKPAQKMKEFGKRFADQF